MHLTQHSPLRITRRRAFLCLNHKRSVMARAAQQHTRKPVASSHAAPKHHSATDLKRGSARARGYSAQWDKFSKSFLRANPLCEFCLCKGRKTAATVTDHDLPHRGDVELFWDNSFSALCSACHSGTKQRLEGQYSGEALLAKIARLKATAPRG